MEKKWTKEQEALVEDVRDKMSGLTDEGYRKFHSALVPGKKNILGIRLPKLRAMAKDLSKGTMWPDYLEAAPNTYYEEQMLRGFIIGYAKMPLDERLERLAAFIPDIDNWAVCDCTCSSLKFTEKNKEAVWAFIEPYFKSESAYDIRFAAVMSMDYYRTEDYAPKVFEYFNGITHEDYYVKMGIAWAVSMFYVALPELTQNFIKTNQMDDFTHNKAIQKIRESRRVSDADKERLNKLKRK